MVRPWCTSQEARTITSPSGKRPSNKGYNLSEYGLFKGPENIMPYKSEAEIYNKLGMDYVPPELRENRGEIEAAKKGSLPRLVSGGDIRGDFHIHTSYSDGSSTVEEMARAAQDLDYEYIAITEHSSLGQDRRGHERGEAREAVEGNRPGGREA